jgi:hypothetical protein
MPHAAGFAEKRAPILAQNKVTEPLKFMLVADLRWYLHFSDLTLQGGQTGATYFINRGGRGLSPSRRAELERAKNLLAERIRKE